MQVMYVVTTEVSRTWYAGWHSMEDTNWCGKGSAARVAYCRAPPTATRPPWYSWYWG